MSRRKKQVNLTVDPDIYNEAMRRFKAMDMSMSAFFEQNVAQFLQATESLVPLIDAVERGEQPNKAGIKALVRSFQADNSILVGDSLTTFGHTLRESGEFLKDTDKK